MLHALAFLRYTYNTGLKAVPRTHKRVCPFHATSVWGHTPVICAATATLLLGASDIAMVLLYFKASTQQGDVWSTVSPLCLGGQKRQMCLHDSCRNGLGVIPSAMWHPKLLKTIATKCYNSPKAALLGQVKAFTEANWTWVDAVQKSWNKVGPLYVCVCELARVLGPVRTWSPFAQDGKREGVHANICKQEQHDIILLMTSNHKHIIYI